MYSINNDSTSALKSFFKKTCSTSKPFTFYALYLTYIVSFASPHVKINTFLCCNPD